MPLVLDKRSSTERSGCERPHIHDYSIVTAVESGRIAMDIANQTIELRQNMLCVIPAGVVHRILEISPDFSRVHVLSISCPVIDQDGKHATRGLLINSSTPYLQFLDWMKPGNSLNALKDRDELLVFFNFLEDCGILLDYQTPNHSSIPGHWIAKQIKELIDSGTDSETCFRLIEERMPFSKEHCNRVFKRFCGSSIQRYSLNSRAEKARLLLRGNLSLAEIATEVGFYDQSQLTRVFKSIYQLTPGQYRKQAKLI